MNLSNIWECNSNPNLCLSSPFCHSKPRFGDIDTLFMSMSGVEVAGLVFGVLPLIVSAVGNYEAAFRPFLTYSRHCKELRDFRTDFATQKQLFQNHCLILLVTQTDSDEAQEILRRASNPKW